MQRKYLISIDFVTPKTKKAYQRIHEVIKTHSLCEWKSNRCGVIAKEKSSWPIIRSAESSYGFLLCQKFVIEHLSFPLQELTQLSSPLKPTYTFGESHSMGRISESAFPPLQHMKPTLRPSKGVKISPTLWNKGYLVGDGEIEFYLVWSKRKTLSGLWVIC